MAWLKEDARTKGHELHIQGPCANIDNLADNKRIMMDMVKDLWWAQEWALGFVCP